VPIFGGASNYAYVCARVKAKKSFLLKKETFRRLLSMDIAEIGRYLGETQYRNEITALGAQYAGATLVELGLSQNLAKTYRDIIDFSGGHLKELIARYLEFWDIYNIKTVIRGKLTAAPADEIREIIVPAGALKQEYINRLITSSSNEELMDLLRQQKVVKIDEEILRNAISTGKLAAFEDHLDRMYYHSLLSSIKEKTLSERRFLEFIRSEVDITNLKALLKLRAEGSSGEALSQYFIPGGKEFRIDRLTKMVASDGMKDVIQEVRQSSYADYMRDALEAFENEAEISSVIRALDRALLETSEKFSHLYPLSVLPVVDYMLRKKREVDNIRIITRGKESNLESEIIEELLVY